jgi:hypothetical protein
MNNRKCIICGKRGKQESINGPRDIMNYYTLCALHNRMIELDTIVELIRLAILKNESGNLDDFIESCQYFMNNV